MEETSGSAVKIISKKEDGWWKIDEEGLKKILCSEEIKDKKVKV